jgi:tuberculosinol/isotuberculosinol synthase
MTIIDRETFLHLPTNEVAKLVRAAGPQVCVFPINGTRRWFILEHSNGSKQSLVAVYQNFFEIMAERYVELFHLCFAHGLDTLVSPTFGPDLLEIGSDYVNMVTDGLAWLATHSTFLDFYEKYSVRVRFYGDYRKAFAPTPYSSLIGQFDKLTADTLNNSKQRIFFGLFAQDATETVAELGVNHYLSTGNIPDKKKLVEMYYGEYVDPATIFIGFDKFSVFDMPLLNTGNESLYFTVNPSPYLTEKQLREILYDHLYTRHGNEPEDLTFMRDFYRANQGKTLGVGSSRQGIWYPSEQVELPPDFREG